MKRFMPTLSAALLTLTAFQAVAFEVDGVLAWSKRITLSTPVSGVVQSVEVVPGQRVEKGARLLSLDPRPVQARRARAAAALKSAEANREEARREMDRATELYDRTVLSDHELKQAEINLAAAEAAYASAHAELKLARLDLEYGRLTAPFDGWVLSRSVEPGETVVNRIEARPLLSLAEAGRMVARTSVGAERAAALSPGMAVAVTVNGERFEGRIRAIGMEPPQGSNLYPLEVEFTTEAVLRAGQRATVDLP